MELSKLGNTVSASISLSNIAIKAGVGYLSVLAFTNINPVIGAVFGVTYGIASAGLDPVFNAKHSTPASQLLGTALKIAISAQVTMLILGTTLSLKTTLAVSLAVLVVAPVVATALLVLASVVGCAAAIALRNRA